MWTLEGLIKHTQEVAVKINGKYVPARPLSWGGMYGARLRFRAAWAVLCGKADAFTWPEGQ